jgi:hypothetical protein
MQAKQDPVRITGLQLTKKVSAAMKRTGRDAASMPVRLKCRHCKKTFTTPQRANGHMEKFHPSDYNVDRDAHVVPPKVKVPKGKHAVAETAPPSDGGNTGSASVAATTASTTVASDIAAAVNIPLTPVGPSGKPMKKRAKPKVKVPKGKRACAETTPPSDVGNTSSASVAATTASTTVDSDIAAAVNIPMTLANTSTPPTVVKPTATTTATSPGDCEAATAVSPVTTEALKIKRVPVGPSDKPMKKRAKQGADAVSGATPIVRAKKMKRKADSGATPIVRAKKMKRKPEADIPYGPSSHQCNCDEYHSEYVHLPVASSSTPLEARAQVWVVDFENESCRLRVIPAVVGTTVASSRGKYYEKDENLKTKGRMLRFDLGNPAAEKWWYADCDISTSRQDAECRLATVLNSSRRYKAGFIKHCDVPAGPSSPSSCPPKLCQQLPLPVTPLLPNLSTSMPLLSDPAIDLMGSIPYHVPDLNVGSLPMYPSGSNTLIHPESDYPQVVGLDTSVFGSGSLPVTL